MRKFILTLFVLAALSILAVLVAGLEGRLRVTLMGFDVATDLSVAVGALLAAALVLVISGLDGAVFLASARAVARPPHHGASTHGHTSLGRGINGPGARRCRCRPRRS